MRVYRNWIRAVAITEGAVFHGLNNRAGIISTLPDSNSSASIVTRAARRAGLDPAPYAGHSLGASFRTQAYLNGVPELAIYHAPGHTSLDTTRKYIRDRNLFRDNSAAKLGL